MCFFTRYEDSFKRDLGGNRQQDLKQEAKEEIEESTRMCEYRDYDLTKLTS